MFKFNSDRSSDHHHVHLNWKSGLLGHRLQVSDEKISELILCPTDMRQKMIENDTKLELKHFSKRKISNEARRNSLEDDSMASLKALERLSESEAEAPKMAKVHVNSNNKTALIYQLARNRLAPHPKLKPPQFTHPATNKAFMYGVNGGIKLSQLKGPFSDDQSYKSNKSETESVTVESLKKF